MEKSNYELGFEEVAEKYPDFPRTVMRKIDTALRGIILTEKALQRAKEEDAFYACPALADKGWVIGGAFFRDGTYVLGLESITRGFHAPSDTLVRKDSPYTLDVVSGKLYLIDSEELEEEVCFAPVPRYFGKKTSRGTPMLKVISSRAPNRISINISSGYCHFFKEKLPCKFCNVIPWSLEKGLPMLANLEDIYETVNETLEEEGGFTSIHLIAGSDPRGNSSYENEVNEYVKVLETLQKCFGREKIPAVSRPGRSGNGSPSHQTVQGSLHAVNRNGSLPVQVIASAFPKEQLRRLADAGLSAYRSNIEVWGEKLFEWICPGKAKYFGREYWIESILQAVEIFGRGNVSTQLVAGAELAKPYGFKTIEEALESSLEGVEFFARYGVHTTFCILWIDRGSVFYREKQELPSLEYYVRLAKGINEIRRKYKLSSDFNDYRRDGFHPDMDLARLDYNKI